MPAVLFILYTILDNKLYRIHNNNNNFKYTLCWKAVPPLDPICLQQSPVFVLSSIRFFPDYYDIETHLQAIILVPASAYLRFLITRNVILFFLINRLYRDQIEAI